ncbi:hypothetical protein DFQ28_005730 [Apophysomyces sp. BC1034]|nr:hypothetical protein DFQ30_003787 [Apophysomyces sp. BC1015]KAG0182617.1 hypothetical protein DFQ29_003170 [Apophysomyces sp. BC1021]KAG0193287.1 hypothetical protein DFQ28_005730 [Apophysomyces sp. BC1034]
MMPHLPPYFGVDTKPPAIRGRKKPNRPFFDSETLDTFCFRWPASHCYVLVRVLDKGIALLPVRSRAAFLYFNHAPLPRHPINTNRPRQKGGIPNMFRLWKHTLALPWEEEEEEEDDNDSEQDTTKHDPEGHRRQTDQSAAVSLSHVIAGEHHLRDAWIKVSCGMSNIKETGDTTLVLQSAHSRILLKARCVGEKRMFLNLVKLVQTLSDPADDDLSTVQADSLPPVLEHYTQLIRIKVGQIDQMSDRIAEAKGIIEEYTQDLAQLDQSMVTLQEAVQHTDVLPQRQLKAVRSELEQSRVAFRQHRDRVKQMAEQLGDHIGFLTAIRLRLHRLKSHVWIPLELYSGLVVLLMFAAVYFFGFT